MSEVHPVVSCRNILGEGAVWSVERQALFWTDIQDRRLWCLDPATGATRSWTAPDRVGCFAFRRDGGLLAAFAEGLAFYDLDSGRVEPLHPFEPDLPTTRPNDGRCDRQGRFLVGGMDEMPPHRPVSGLWRLNPDRSLERLVAGIAIANSLCFSPDGRTLYRTDTPRRVILAHDYDPDTGCLGEPRVFHALPPGPGVPDGSTIDAEGFLWNAEHGGGRVVRYAPDGRVDRVVIVPTPNPTCPAFGGADLGTLYVTSAAEGVAGDPLAGSLFAVEVEVRGLPEPLFAG